MVTGGPVHKIPGGAARAEDVRANDKHKSARRKNGAPKGAGAFMLFFDG